MNDGKTGPLQVCVECIYHPAAMSMVSDYHGKRTRSRAMGILQTSVYVGTVVEAIGPPSSRKGMAGD